MSDILARILTAKHAEVERCAAQVPLHIVRERAEAKGQLRGFADAVCSRARAGNAAFIAEIKKASPSRGVLREDFDPAWIAQRYASHGAACLSVLTDQPFFQGKPQDLESARSVCGVPVLRKDFIVDAYQVYEARAMGADAILLIVACLDDGALLEYETLAHALGMAVLVEAHDAVELERALRLRTPLVGINNRNLKTMDISLGTVLSLRTQVPADRTVVCESGLRTHQDVVRMQDAGIHAFLVGSACMTASDPGLALAELFG
ncbi:indole-3-glycerol phosphate synthase TrpC [Candidatus Symbiobacter mobilis]|uniref:Indole-3-glycerol phosphate synthase n=1 Tax=Candidatus Symbiobacter mobilis CR TaxID=946483 RepID=U5NAC4_9BURK|nr:indole-3-glycerol phosphate synthase TrpC [Candidatus Symbiobacter mobilis]AGX87144.1 indole-3-glycerol phosphate synthase [Candidatus Symbiobacter mobilis CR]